MVTETQETQELPEHVEDLSPWTIIPATEWNDFELKRRLRKSALPQRLRQPLSTWVAPEPAGQPIAKAALRYMAEFPKVTNLLFIGDSGRGKTHLAASMAYEICLLGHEVRFAVMTEWFRAIKATYSPDYDGQWNEADFVEDLAEGNLVILDDLTSPRPERPASDWEMRVLRDLLNALERNDARRIVTTNLASRDLTRWLREASVESRLYDNCRVVDTFNALPDWRRQAVAR